ncbi:MAG: zinc ribbon domain-containing protein [Clostridia bacterium]|nr:zinc ribbon domain-containing protein [Clostridia bacterium]
MLCPKCKKEIADGVQFCPECGVNVANKKKPVTKKWWFWVIIAVAFIVIIGAAGSSGEDENNTDVNNSGVVQSTETTVVEVTTVEKTTEKEITEKQTTTAKQSEAPAMNESEYKASCESIGYKDIARQPDTYKGRNVVFTGEVMQVQESSYSKNVVLLIKVTKDNYGYWDDAVYVTYKLPDGAPRILEDDIVKFYGECEGTYTYETVMGSSNTIPRVSALYIDLQ